MALTKKFIATEEELLEQRQRALGRDLTNVELWRVAEDAFYLLLEQEGFDDAISYLHHQYERGGGTLPVEMVMLELYRRKDVARIHKLFRGLIPGCLDAFWSAWPHAERGSPDGIKSAAVSKGYALKWMYEYHFHLHQLGDLAGAEQVKADMLLLHANQKRKTAVADQRSMSDDIFWELIENASVGARTARQFAAALGEKLQTLPPKEIRRFDELLRARLSELWSWDLWALAYLVRGGCSDDGFDYFRAWIVARGRDAYLAALNGPQALVEAAPLMWDLQCEELFYAADKAYYEQAGTPMPPVKTPKTVERGKKWTPADLPKRYPALWARFGKG